MIDTARTPGKAPHGYPSTPRQQLAIVSRFNAVRGWGLDEASFPEPPDHFKPATDSEMLLLDVKLPGEGEHGGLQRTIEELWEAIVPPRGFTKHRPLDTACLRLTDGRDWQAGVRWVGFEPDTYPNYSPIQARIFSAATGERLAGTEVLCAAVLLPPWGDSWRVDGADRPLPNLSGLELVRHDGWTQVPYIDRWDSDEALILEAGRVESALVGWASPVVREIPTHQVR